MLPNLFYALEPRNNGYIYTKHCIEKMLLLAARGKLPGYSSFPGAREDEYLGTPVTHSRSQVPNAQKESNKAKFPRPFFY